MLNDERENIISNRYLMGLALSGKMYKYMNARHLRVIEWSAPGIKNFENLNFERGSKSTMPVSISNKQFADIIEALIGAGF
jgi:endoribonuclease Dicer